MLHYDGFKEETLSVEPIGKKDYIDYNELLSFYDNELSERFIEDFKKELEDVLDEHSLLQDFLLLISYSEIENRVNIELTSPIK
jgi:hypothetical protein